MGVTMSTIVPSTGVESPQPLTNTSEMVVVETISCFVCYRTHSSAGPWCQNGAIVAKGSPPPETCKATVGWDQIGGREMVGQRITK